MDNGGYKKEGYAAAIERTMLNTPGTVVIVKSVVFGPLRILLVAARYRRGQGRLVLRAVSTSRVSKYFSLSVTNYSPLYACNSQYHKHTTGNSSYFLYHRYIVHSVNVCIVSMQSEASLIL